MSDELKPCPFCGGKAGFLHAHGEYYACCSDPFCIATETFYTKEKAAEAWNTRQALERLDVDVTPIEFLTAISDVHSGNQEEGIRIYKVLSEKGLIGQPIDFDAMRKHIIHPTGDPSIDEGNIYKDGYNQALDDLKAKHGLPPVDTFTGHSHTLREDFEDLQKRIFDAESKGIHLMHPQHMIALLYNLNKAVQYLESIGIKTFSEERSGENAANMKGEGDEV